MEELRRTLGLRVHAYDNVGLPNYVALALFGVSTTLGLTVFLAVKGDDDYTLD